MKALIFLFFLTFNSLTAQVTQEWIATYNGTGTGTFFSTKNAIDNSGNLIVGGNCDVGTSTDFLILKYNSSGGLLWARRYDGPQHLSDRLRDMVLDDSGNIYVIGSSNQEQSLGYSNWLTIKYSPDGDLRWVQTMDWTLHSEDIPFSMALDKDRNVFVAGYGRALPDNIMNFDMILTKYDNNGVWKWSQSYDSQPFHTDWGYSVVTDDSNCAYISGYSYPENIITIKYDPEGNQKWLKEYYRMSGEYAIPLYSTIDNQKNIIVNGYYEFFNQSVFVTLKYDRNGNLLWDRVFDRAEGNQDVKHAICVDDSMNIFITGRTETSENGHDIFVIKYKPDGDTMWTRTYDNGFGETDEGEDVAVDSFGNVYVTGTTVAPPNSDESITLKFDKNGDFKWSRIFSKIGSNGSNSISVDHNKNIFVTGSGNRKILAVKYSQLTDIKFTNIIENKSYGLRNYPNPFNPNTKINYTLQIRGTVQLIIYNSSGKEIKNLTYKDQNPGNYEVSFDGSNLSSGIYFCTLITNNLQTQTIKMILLK
ncbi:MAG: SBBP repeat-containing protein [bacterium]|nr:SBBP repeat-containing protein [bacterium]